jgi:hypothetical protein
MGQSWPNFKKLYRHPPEGTEENHKTIRQDSRSPGGDLNLLPLEYKAGVLTTRSRCSVYCFINNNNNNNNNNKSGNSLL